MLGVVGELTGGGGGGGGGELTGGGGGGGKILFGPMDTYINLFMTIIPRIKSGLLLYRLELVKHHLLTLSVSRATIDGVNDARFL